MRRLAHVIIAATALAGCLPLAVSAQPPAPATAASAPAPGATPARTRAGAPPAQGGPCRAISAEMRGAGPYTREAVVREMVRARAEGEMDFHISTTPPALQRPLCPLP